MRELSVNEVNEVSGGVVVTTAVAVVAGITAVAGMIVAAYNAGKIAGEIAQRNHEAQT